MLRDEELRVALESNSSADPRGYQVLDRATNKIRLIKMRPPMERLGVDLEVEVFELNNAPIFSALSYTWGSPMEEYCILVNNKPFQVRANLFSFLLEYQAGLSSDTYIWIDQISIDQSNVLERHHQVHLMGRIYSMSHSVIVWLGCSQRYLDAARRFNEAPSTGMLAVFSGDNYFQRLWIVRRFCLHESSEC
jgi:hypothetical protein